MATSSICSTFSTLLISNSNSSSTKSIPSSISSWKGQSLLLPTTKIYFQSKAPFPPIALSAPTPRAYSYERFPEDDDEEDEEEEEVLEDEEDIDEEDEDAKEKMAYIRAEEAENEEDEEAKEKMAYIQAEEETDEEEQWPRSQPEGEFDSSMYEGIFTQEDLDIAAGYETLYGPAWSGISVLGNDVDAADKELDRDMERVNERVRDDLEESIVQVRRVAKVREGGKSISFRAVVVVGDKKGKVGVGVGNAIEISDAVKKACKDARRHVVDVRVTKSNSFPHRAEGRYGAAKVLLKPSPAGSGVVAGGAVRIVLEMAGIENGMGKQLGSPNPLNNARAVVDAFSKMRHFHEVAAYRGIPMEELWK